MRSNRRNEPRKIAKAHALWKGGRVVEGTGLENRQGLIAPRGFESHPFRHILVRSYSSSSANP